MRTTVKEDREFLESIISTSLLEDAIDFIKDKYSAEEVYGRDVMEDWALENGFVSIDREAALMDEISDLEAENETLQRELNDYNG